MSHIEHGQRKASHVTYNEFPEIEIPAFLRGDQWVDCSWHNDVCPRSEITIDDATDQHITVWVAFDAIEDREFPEMKKFAVLHHRNFDDDEGLPLYEGDDPTLAEAACRSLFQSLGRKY